MLLRKIAAALALLLFIPASLEAADLLKKQPVQVDYDPLFKATNGQWTGLYGGISLAYGFGDSEQSYTRAGNHGIASTEPEGWAGSITLGYNHQFANGFVFGGEADLGFMDISADDKLVFDGHVFKTRFGPLWGTVRGRAGFAMNNLLIFGTAGIAFMEVDEVSVGNTPGETAVNMDFRAGWTVGGGIEYAFSQKLTGKLEYLYMDFGRHEGLSANNEAFYFDNEVQLIRVGFNYRF